MKGYYHVSSHGLEKNDIFKSREDFIAGMNDIAICILGFDIQILCFCLMSNHFHFLLYGTSEECRRFADEYKRRCAMGMRLRSGEVQGLIHMAFRKESIVQLSMDQRLKLCLLMKKNFNAGVRQISRVTRLDPELVSKVV